MAMQFLFKHCKDPKDHKSEKVIKPFALYLNRQGMHSDSPNWMEILAGSVHKMEGNHQNIKIVAALFLVTPSHYLIYVELCVIIHLRCTPKKMHKKRFVHFY